MPISKNIFFFWGNETMSWMRYMTLYSFRKLNPEWNIRLYRVPQSVRNKPWQEWNEQDFFNYKGKDYSDKIKELNIEVRDWSPPQKIQELTRRHKVSASHLSNFFKWYFLATSGGIYSDLDILYIRPMDEFYNEIQLSSTAICFDKWMSIGLLGSSGNNQFFHDLLNHAIRTFNPNRYQIAGVLAIYSLLKCEYQDSYHQLTLKYNNIHNFPYEYFYPFPPDKVEQAFMSGNKIPRDTIGFHWFAAHPVSQKYNNMLNDENWKKINVTFTELIKEFL